MSLTISTVTTNLNTYLGDSSTDRITEAERFQALTEATSWLEEELGNEHMVDTYELGFLETVNNYKVTTDLANLLVGADLRRDKDDHNNPFARKSPREIAVEIGKGVLTDPSWAIDRYDDDTYLAINYQSKYIATIISDFNTITDSGTWTLDTTNSDATNLTTDTNEFKKGAGSVNFDLDVSQSGNNYATMYAPDANSRDLSAVEDLGSFVYWVYIPDSTYTTSFTLTWGSDESTTPSGKSNYWAATVTTDINGNAWVDGWNQVRINWSDSTATGSPDSSAIVYYELRLTYNASQADDTDYRFDYLRVVQPETLTFHYVSWKVGTDTGGTDITAFSATTDVPFFSGQYDQYKYAVAHKAASILYYSALRLPEQGAVESGQADLALKRYRNNFESGKVREVKSFKVFGVNLRRRSKRGRR